LQEVQCYNVNQQVTPHVSASDRRPPEINALTCETEDNIKFEVLKMVKKSMLVFWVVTPCGLVGRYKRFAGTNCLHFQGSIALLPRRPVSAGEDSVICKHRNLTQ
jgi:hypothetical protein